MLPLLLALAGPAQDTGPDGPAPLVLEHVTVIPMDRERRLPDHTVVVADGRIVALGPAGEVALPEGALRVDGAGRFLMPGLADMHVHVWDENDLFLFVANGVTTVRNMFGDPLHLGWRARIDAGELVGPRLYTAGPIIDGKPVVWPGSTELTDPDEAAAVVAAQKEAGYDFLKPYARLSRECYEALAIAAEEQGMAMMGHVPDGLALADVVEAGQVTVEHLGGVAAAVAAEGGPPGAGPTAEFTAWARLDGSRLEELARALAEGETWHCPTLVVYSKWARGDAASALLARPEMRYVSPFMLSAWDPASPNSYLSTMPDELVALAHASIPFMQRAVGALSDAEVGLVAGTDMGNPFVTAGFALHEELALLAGAGLTPFEVLRAATSDAARCMDAAGEWGTVAVGLRADLLLLEADPLDDVAHAARRVGVVLRGRWMPAAELTAELERRAESFGR